MAKKAVEKSTKKAVPATKAEKKSGKTSAKAEAATGAPAEELSADAREELEEQQEAAAAAATGGGNAAALAAAGTQEMSASFKNFRHHPDMENFYRFIYENDLRHEALAIIDEIMVQKQNRKLAKVAKSKAH